MPHEDTVYLIIYVFALQTITKTITETNQPLLNVTRFAQSTFVVIKCDD